MVGDQELTFRVSGKLWMRSLVMVDVETKTEWSHLLGRGMAGELKGAVLEPVVSDMVTWGAWLKANPGTSVLNMKRTTENYSRDFYRDLERFVFGFEVGGKFWHVTMAQLVEKPVHTFNVGGQHLVLAFDESGMVVRVFEATVDERDLDFVAMDTDHMQDAQTNSTWSIAAGEAIRGPHAGSRLEQRVGIMSFKSAWVKFHPRSTESAF